MNLFKIFSVKAMITFSFLLLLASIQMGCTSGKSPKKQKVEQKPLVVFLVRHAEKADLTKDPELTESGKERALELAKVLRSANIEYIHSTNFIRTRETAMPTAQELRLTTEIYDPGNLEKLVQKLRDYGGNHLVVGHSNTTPSMVSLLGGNPGSKINEANEYDRLYIVTNTGDGDVSSILIRYGHPYYESNGK